MRWLLVLLAAACASTPRPPHATLAFRDVRVFDGERTLARANVLVDGGKIVAVGSSVPIPAGVEIVEGAGKTLLPGLIDAHAHDYDPAQLEQALAFGVTTVLDMFTAPQVLKQLHAADGPGHADLRSAGFLATAPGGHGTEYGIPVPTLTSPGEAQAWVDARVAEGSDWIKIVIDDGRAYGVKFPTLDQATVAALVAAAHARGKLAVAHIGTYEDARAALDAGVDGLVHLFGDRAPPEGFGAFVASKKAFVVPTLALLRSLQGTPSPLGSDEDTVRYLAPDAQSGLRRSFRMHVQGPASAPAQTVAQLRAAGVPILAGTDSPNPGTTHGASLHDELALLVAAGLPPTAALAGATSLPARIFGLPDRGRIAAGARADLLLVEGDPTVDIQSTRAISGIWREGVRFDRESYRARLPRAATPTPGGAFQPGPISNFDDGTLAVRTGQTWIESTDVLIGGVSTVELKVEGGALSITGELVTGKALAAWAGAMYMPGAQRFAPADLSAAKGIRFRARGDGKPFSVMIFAKQRGRMPAVQPFTPGKDFGVVELPWKAFDGLDGSDIMGVLIGQSTQAGRFALVVDDFEIR